MLTDANQNTLKLAFGVHRGPREAPSHIVRQITSEAQALDVSILAGHHKAAYIARCVGCSEAYVSQMRRAKRPIPARLVEPLCAATGSTLLAQYIRLEQALAESTPVNRLADLLRAA